MHCFFLVSFDKFYKLSSVFCGLLRVSPEIFVRAPFDRTAVSDEICIKEKKTHIH